MDAREPFLDCLTSGPSGTSLSGRRAESGQAVVEFTLSFVLLLVIAWIPADFGLALYSGQMALNATRDGARIAAAQVTLAAGTTTCTMPCAGERSGNPTGVLAQTANRLNSALLPGATINFTVQGGTTCDRLVTVAISSSYNYFFYKFLRLLTFTVPDSVTINRSSSMRWEHQC